MAGRRMSQDTCSGVENPIPKASGEACLVVIHAPVPRLFGAHLGLTRGEVLLGRDPHCDLVLEANDVSRRHACVRGENEHHVLEDLGSRNGTFVGGERIQTRELVPGDLVRLGSVVLKYLEGDDLEVLYHAEMKRLADEDGLTGLAHKVVFSEALAREVARSRRHGHALSLALLDLDAFKEVNDTFGHLVGDMALRDVSASIKPLVRAEQLFARMGGDEFALLLPDVPLEMAARFGEKARRLVEERVFSFRAARIRLTVSVGIADLQERDHAAEDLLHRADARLYDAKKAGGNRVCS
jgi:diguanylate cyclase (GGDEF)-like protein